MSESDFFSIKEFAGKLGVHSDTVRRSIKSGRVAAFKVGSGKRARYRISKSEISRIALFDLETLVNQIIEKRKSLD